jgi:type II secretory pathway predicted ATPase ExeA
VIDRLQAHYGFTRMPFGRDLAPGMLHRHAAHGEAAARITWCVADTLKPTPRRPACWH